MDFFHQRLQRAPTNLAQVTIVIWNKLFAVADAVNAHASPSQIVVSFAKAAIANERGFGAHGHFPFKGLVLGWRILRGGGVLAGPSHRRVAGGYSMSLAARTAVRRVAIFRKTERDPNLKEAGFGQLEKERLEAAITRRGFLGSWPIPRLVVFC